MITTIIFKHQTLVGSALLGWTTTGAFVFLKWASRPKQEAEARGRRRREERRRRKAFIVALAQNNLKGLKQTFRRPRYATYVKLSSNLNLAETRQIKLCEFVIKLIWLRDHLNEGPVDFWTSYHCYMLPCRLKRNQLYQYVSLYSLWSIWKNGLPPSLRMY